MISAVDYDPKPEPVVIHMTPQAPRPPNRHERRRAAALARRKHPAKKRRA